MQRFLSALERLALYAAQSSAQRCKAATARRLRRVGAKAFGGQLGLVGLFYIHGHPPQKDSYYRLISNVFRVIYL